MPASSETFDYLIWRIPGLPLQGWKLNMEQTSSDIQVVVSSFNGETQTFNAQGPYNPETALNWLNKNGISELNLKSSSNREAYEQAVSVIVDQIQKEKLRKVVLSRREVIEVDLDLKSTLGKLMDTYPDALVYALRTRDELWVGATPETLIRTDEHAIYTMALAGTRSPNGPPFSEKEFDEQSAVTEYIREELLKLGAEKVICKGPAPVQAGPVEHLQTNIEASVPKVGDAISWAKAMHPTPAVSGYPRDRATEIIHDTENYNRELYAGFFGWISPESARFYVNLRCMRIGRGQVALYAGGGVTAQSDAAAEWIETENKLKTLKSVIL